MGKKRNKKQRSESKDSLRSKRLFVYGTLQGAEYCSVPYIRELLTQLESQTASTLGRLYLPSFVNYPVALFSTFLDGSLIHGRLLNVNDDDLETFDIYENVGTLYERVRIDAVLSNGSLVTNVYAYQVNPIRFDISDAVRITNGDFIDYVYGGK